MKPSFLRLLGMLILLTALPAIGEVATTVVEGDGFRVKLLPQTKISARKTTARLSTMAVALDEQKARIRSHSGGTTILFPDNAIRIKEKTTAYGYSVTVDLPASAILWKSLSAKSAGNSPRKKYTLPLVVAR